MTVDGFTISGTRIDGSPFETVRPAIQDNGLIKDLMDNNVEIVGKQPEQQSIWTQLLVASFPDSGDHRGVHVLHAPDAGRRWR